MRRVAVSGIGVVSPLGNSAAEVLATARAGRSGVRRLETPFASGSPRPSLPRCEFDDTAYFDAAEAAHDGPVQPCSRCSRPPGVLACKRVPWQAIDRARAGVFVGTGMGGAHTIDEGYQHALRRRLGPHQALHHPDGHAQRARRLDRDRARSPRPELTYSTACSSSTVAIGEAWSASPAGSSTSRSPAAPRRRSRSAR